jgi:hypothetical protein
VRGLTHVGKRGKTPVLTEEQARQLISIIKVARKATLSGVVQRWDVHPASAQKKSCKYHSD